MTGISNGVYGISQDTYFFDLGIHAFLAVLFPIATFRKDSGIESLLSEQRRQIR